MMARLTLVVVQRLLRAADREPEYGEQSETKNKQIPFFFPLLA